MNDPLKAALLLLSAVHTQDDREYGFLAALQPRLPPGISLGDYARAWGVVRRSLGQFA